MQLLGFDVQDRSAVLRMSSQTKRLVCACGIVVVLFATLAITASPGRSMTKLVDDAIALGQADASTDKQSASWGSTSSVASYAHAGSGSDLPHDFIAEVSSLDGARDIRVSEDGLTIGCTFSRSSQEIQSFLRAELEENGWTYVESGSSFAVTYVKETGTYSWALVVVGEIAGKTSVVIQMATPPSQ